MRWSLFLLLGAACASAAQPVPHRVDGTVDPVALTALLPVGPAPGQAGSFGTPDVSSDVHRQTVHQRASVSTQDGPDRLYVTVSVSTSYGVPVLDSFLSSFGPADTLDVSGFNAALFESKTGGADHLLVALSPTRSFQIQGPNGSRDVLLATARAVDLAAIAALPGTHTLWVDPVRERVVDPAAPERPVVVRSPSRAALARALGTPPGWRLLSERTSALPLDPDTDDVFSDSTSLSVERCFEPATDAEQALASEQPPALRRYRAFNPVYFCGSGGSEFPPPPRPRVCLTLIAATDTQVESWLAEPDPYATPVDTTLAGRPARVSRYGRSLDVLLRQPGGLLVAKTGDSLAVLEGLLGRLGPVTVPPPTMLVAFDRSPRYSDQGLWDGAFTTPLAPGRIVVQNEHWSAFQMETAWPAGWTWTDPDVDGSDQFLWLAEAGPLDAQRPESLFDAATTGLVLVYARGVRPDRLLAMRDTLAEILEDGRAGFMPFLGWTLSAPPAPADVSGWPAAVSMTLYRTVGGVDLVVQAVDAVWQGTDAAFIAVVSRVAEADRALAALNAALARTAFSRF